MTEIKKVHNQWTTINLEVKRYQYCLIALFILCIILSLGLVISLFQDPIVVLTNKMNQQIYFSGKKTETNPNKGNVEDLVREFVRLRFTFKSSDLSLMAQNISPFATVEYVKASFDMLSKELNQNKQQGEIVQTVGEIQVVVTDKEVKAYFDKIVRFKGIPLISPSSVELQLLKNRPNYWNPWGLYINGVIEHESQ